MTDHTTDTGTESPANDPTPSTAFYEVYEDAAGQWRWRLKAANGRIIADSGQGYTSKGAVYVAVATVRDTANATDVRTLPETDASRLARARERFARLVAPTTAADPDAGGDD